MAVQFLAPEHLPDLFEILCARGYELIGPTVRDGAIMFDHIFSVDDLPRGIETVQKPGSYTLVETESSRYFSWTNGPSALKPLLYKSRQPLWQAEQVAEATDNGLVFRDVEPDATLRAVIGVRPCDIAAMQLHDKHFLEGSYPDVYYDAARKKLLIIAVNCSHCSETCFCASTGDGPAAGDGYDLLLDELDGGFLVRAGSEIGEHLLALLPVHPASSDMQEQAEAQTLTITANQKRFLINENMHANLFSQLDSRYWHKIAERCLSCGNCTAVCPTCFCHREVDAPDLDGQTSTHYREWSSCFNHDHSVLHGSALRDSSELRYRQWMLHKLGSWNYQYGRSGCVGCGRCIAWCPAAIDFPAEANALSGEVELWEQ